MHNIIEGTKARMVHSPLWGPKKEEHRCRNRLPEDVRCALNNNLLFLSPSACKLYVQTDVVNLEVEVLA